MKFFATASIFVVTALAALVPVAAAGTTPLSDMQLSRSGSVQTSTSSQPTARYIKTYGLAPSPEALASTAPDLVERYVGSHPSASSEPTARYIKTYGLAPSPEALAVSTSASDGGTDWNGITLVGGGVLFVALLLATAATIALKHRSRDRYAAA